MLRTTIAGCAMIAMLGTAVAARADVVLLKSGGKVDAVSVDRSRDEEQGDVYVVETAAGVRMTLAADAVEKVVKRQPERAELDRIRPQYPDTVEGQWELAEWCRQRHLAAERKEILQRIIELDPDHEKARRALGYARFGGVWKTQKEELLSRGYVEDPKTGRMVLPQVAEERERRKALEAAQRKWKQQLHRWRGWLQAGGPRAAAAEQALLSIHDPEAVPALRDYLKDEPVDVVRKLYMEVLAQINTPAAWRLLADVSLLDENEDLRLTSVDHLAESPQPVIVDYYIGKLHDKNNWMINRAAIGLSAMKDPRAVRPLIDALISEHKTTINTNPGGSTSASFGSGGGGFSAGNSTKVVTQKLRNPEVLEALISLTGGVNFQYDERAWKNWYTQTRRVEDVDLRRN